MQQVPRLVMTPSTLAHSTGGKAAVEDVSKLSKSQKKRRKRKAAKEGSAVVNNNNTKPVEQAAAAVVPPTAPKASGATLNPTEKIRERLVAEGYTAKEVQRAMDEMWDKNMNGYDDYDAVRTYLRGASEAQDESTAPSTAPSMTMMDEPSWNGNHFEEAVEEEKEETEDASISTASSQHLDMGARLDMVAESEDLGDSAFALNKWISEMAKQSELEGFCSGNKSRALFTIIRRSIEEPSDSSLPSVLTMVTSVFTKAGMDSLSASEMKSSLRLVLQQARTAYSKNKEDQEALAECIANAIVTRISGLVQELMSHEDDDASKSIRQLEKEIDSLSTSLNNLGQCGIAELIQNRDTQKSAADKALTVVNIAMGAVPQDGNVATVQVSSVTKDEVLLSLVGEDGLEKMNANKAAHDAVRQKMKEAEARTSPEYQALKMNLSTFQGERSLVADKIEELKNELKQLEEKDAMLERKIEGTEKEIAALHESSSGEMQKLQAELAKTSKAAESDFSVRSLADRLAIYETSVKQSVVGTSSVHFNGNEDMSNLVPEKLSSYLVRARNYFRAEADCVQFLQSRVRNLDTEANSLNNELEELKSLGLATNARQVEISLQQAVDNIKEDNDAIAHLCGEAAKTRDEVVNKLEAFGAELSSTHMSVLRGIVSAMVELEVEIGGLEQFVQTASNGHASKAPQAMNGSHSAAVQKQTSATADATPAQLAPKLTWATKMGVEATKTESLRNIQEEELSSQK